MATENDGGAPEAPTSDQDAFAATVAPTTATPTPPMRPSKSPTGSRAVSGAEATVAADLVGALPPLPEVSAALYQTAGEIARGGMGRIVAAEDRRLGRQVALKELLESSRRAARAVPARGADHRAPAAPRHRAGLRGRPWPTGEPFFAMKLVAGEPLDQVDRRGAHARASGSRCCRASPPSCDAIAYAHSQRIIHRDLKPGQRADRRVRRDGRDRLGPREGSRRGRERRVGESRAARPSRSNPATTDRRRYRRGRRDGHARVHGARASARRGGRPTRRRVSRSARCSITCSPARRRTTRAPRPT